MKRYPIGVRIQNMKCPECFETLTKTGEYYSCPSGCVFWYSKDWKGQKRLCSRSHKRNTNPKSPAAILNNPTSDIVQETTIRIGERTVATNRKTSVMRLPQLIVSRNGNSISLPISTRVAKTLKAFGVAS